MGTWLWEYKLVQPFWRTVCNNLIKLKICRASNLGIQYLGICPREISIDRQRERGKDGCTGVYIATL